MNKYIFESKEERAKFLSQNPDLVRECRICKEQKPIQKMMKNHFSNGRWGIGWRCCECRNQKKTLGRPPATIQHFFDSAQDRNEWAKQNEELFECRDCRELKRAIFFKRATRMSAESKLYCFESSCRACQTVRVVDNIRKLTSTTEGIIEHKIRKTKGRLRGKNIEFDLDVPYILNLWEQQNGKCCYSGDKMRLQGYGSGKATKNSCTFDRVDPTKGYVKGNVVLCCMHVNTMKSNLSVEEFVSLCVRIMKFRKVDP